jgi:hypothetical protein
MTEVNFDLRKAIQAVKDAADPIPDIAEQVKLHAKTAWTLSQMEKVPPGYTRTEWALFLMDIPRLALMDRLHQRADAAHAKIPPTDANRLLEHALSVMPSIPKANPAGMTPKMIALDREWTTELVDRKVHEALNKLVGMPLSKATMMVAKAKVQEVVKALTARLGRLPVRVRITGTNEPTGRAGFKILLEDI